MDRAHVVVLADRAEPLVRQLETALVSIAYRIAWRTRLSSKGFTGWMRATAVWAVVA